MTEELPVGKGRMLGGKGEVVGAKSKVLGRSADGERGYSLRRVMGDCW